MVSAHRKRIDWLLSTKINASRTSRKFFKAIMVNVQRLSLAESNRSFAEGMPLLLWNFLDIRSEKFPRGVCVCVCVFVSCEFSAREFRRKAILKYQMTISSGNSFHRTERVHHLCVSWRRRWWFSSVIVHDERVLFFLNFPPSESWNFSRDSSERTDGDIVREQKFALNYIRNINGGVNITVYI